MTSGYEEFYGMSRSPFVRNIPPGDLFENEALREAVFHIKHTIEREEFGIVVGDPGVGKSTLIRKVAAILPREQYLTMYLSDSQLSPRWLYSGLLEKLGMDAEYYRFNGKRKLKGQLKKVGDKHVAAFIDEAHLAGHELLEESRFVLNDEYDSKSVMALILVGQTELWEQKLAGPAYTAIRQRITCKIKLTGFDRADTGRYVRHQLSYAQGKEELFTDKALDRIYEITHGVPRVINTLCDATLLYGAQQNHRRIDDYAVTYVAENESIGG